MHNRGPVNAPTSNEGSGAVIYAGGTIAQCKGSR